MTISKDDASQALSDIETAEGRLWQAKTYNRTSPFLVIWGLVWIAADLATQFEPRWGLVWPIGVLVGTAASFAAGFLLPRGAAEPGAWRNVALWFVIFGFIFSLFLVIPVTNGAQMHSVFGLFFGFLYMGFGLWMGWRIVALGAALAALTLIGYFEIKAWYYLYMGLVSGGALLLGGLWLRKI